MQGVDDRYRSDFRAHPETLRMQLGAFGSTVGASYTQSSWAHLRRRRLPFNNHIVSLIGFEALLADTSPDL